MHAGGLVTSSQPGTFEWSRPGEMLKCPWHGWEFDIVTGKALYEGRFTVAEALLELAKVGFDPVFGARPLKRAIQQRIENPLSKLLLEGKFLPKDTIAVNVDPVRAPGEFAFTKAEV